MIVNEALATLDADFAGLYARIGRPSIPPEQLLRAMLLQLFYAIRSGLLLVERLDFDLSFRWFVGLGIDVRVWDASTFSKNRDRLLDGDVAVALLAAILDRPQVKRLLATEHFSVDGTLIEAWASMKSFLPKDGGDGGDPPVGGGSTGEGNSGCHMWNGAAGKGCSESFTWRSGAIICPAFWCGRRPLASMRSAKRVADQSVALSTH